MTIPIWRDVSLKIFSYSLASVLMMHKRLRPALGKQIFKMVYSCHSDCKSRNEGFHSIYVGLCRKHSLFVLFIQWIIRIEEHYLFWKQKTCNFSLRIFLQRNKKTKSSPFACISYPWLHKENSCHFQTKVQIVYQKARSTRLGKLIQFNQLALLR